MSLPGGAALAWLGRQGPRAVAASVFLGLALPQLAGLFRPLFPAIVFAMLVLAFLRVPPAELGANFAAPRRALAATAWIMLALPALLGIAFAAAGVARADPALHLALMLQAAAPPIVSGPAFAMMLGLPAALALAVVAAAMAAMPLSSPAFVELFAGTALTIGPVQLGIRLVAFLIGAFALGALLRRWFGAAKIAAAKDHLDGINVVLLFCFAVAPMEGLAAQLWAAPLWVLGLLALTFLLALAQVAATTLLFAPAVGRGAAFALAICAGHRNMGLMFAGVGTAVPETVWVYFALAQFPIFLMPYLLTPVARRLR